MKKFLKLIALTLTLALACCAFAACGDKDDNPDDEGEGGTPTTPSVLDKSLFTGEYELYSVMSGVPGDDETPIIYTVGDSVPAGMAGNAEDMILTADYQTLTLGADGTFNWLSDYTMSEYNGLKVINGTWVTTKTGVSLTLTGTSYVYAGTLKDGKLTLTYMQDVTVFTKK